VQWYVRSDAINAERSFVDPAVLRTAWNAGGLIYGTCLEGYEILRPATYKKEMRKDEVHGLARRQEPL
jgi:hypothetical protein